MTEERKLPLPRSYGARAPAVPFPAHANLTDQVGEPAVEQHGQLEVGQRCLLRQRRLHRRHERICSDCRLLRLADTVERDQETINELWRELREPRR